MSYLISVDILLVISMDFLLPQSPDTAGPRRPMYSQEFSKDTLNFLYSRLKNFKKYRPSSGGTCTPSTPYHFDMDITSLRNGNYNPTHIILHLSFYTKCGWRESAIQMVQIFCTGRSRDNFFQKNDRRHRTTDLNSGD